MLWDAATAFLQGYWQSCKGLGGSIFIPMLRLICRTPNKAFPAAYKSQLLLILLAQILSSHDL